METGTPAHDELIVRARRGFPRTRFFCHFLSRLDPAMAGAGKPYVANLLERRAERGLPDQPCSRRRPVGMIEAGGRIRVSEFSYCIDCRAPYHGDQVRPPLAREAGSMDGAGGRLCACR